MDVPAPNLDTRVNVKALNTEFIGILDVDTLPNEEGMNDTINYYSLLETPTKAPASSVSSSFTKSSSKYGGRSIIIKGNKTNGVNR